jgi:S-adenosylmethionine hydrolase
VHDTITFLSDFGLVDEFVGVCHGVMRRIAPDVTILDVSHGVPAQAVGRGALVLARALPFLPAGVHLAVVDPGVGSERRGVAIRTNEGRVLVGPDNGLLVPAADGYGIAAVRVLTNPHYHLEPVSRTFHARDVFAPVAAHLAAGAHFDDLGEEVDPAGLVRIELSRAALAAGVLRATVVAVDNFGNIEFDFGSAELAALDAAAGSQLELSIGDTRHRARAGETFADAAAGGLVLYVDSFGAAELALRDGSAAALTAALVGTAVAIRLADGAPPVGSEPLRD